MKSAKSVSSPIRFLLFGTIILGVILPACQGGAATTPTPPAAVATKTAVPATPSTTPEPTQTPPPSPTDQSTATITTIPSSATATATKTAVSTTLPTSTPPPTTTPVIDVQGAYIPPGFSLRKFADLYRPTGLAFDANGRLFTTSVDGTVRVLTDADGDGRADNAATFATGFDTPLGIAVRPGTNDVYVSSKGNITILRDTTGNAVADSRTTLISGLPTGLHQNDNLKFGPDGLLYMGVGSTCDVCAEADPRSATIMRFNPDSGAGEIFATGMRNPYDLAFHPLTGDLFATDNGRDDLGEDAPPEELNHIVQGADYGWPDCWGDYQGDNCDGTQKAVAFFEPRSSANSIDFYNRGQFPPAYRGSAYVAVFGSFVKPSAQTGVVRVALQPSGNTYTAQTSWFAQWPGAMPLGLIVGPDGALYVGDYINNAVYRISYDS